MTDNKRIQLPKESLQPHTPGPGEQFLDETDVEGHGWTNPAPPIDFSKRLPSGGGELEPSESPEESGRTA